MHTVIYEKHQVVLKPDAKQRHKIEALFAGPVVLADLLGNSGGLIQCAEEASLFLLRNKGALEPYLSTVDRDSAVDSLKSLLMQWAGSPPEQLELKFDSGSISSTQQIWLPLRSLGALHVADTLCLAQVREGKRYVPDKFSLIRESSETYAVNIVLSSKRYLEGTSLGRDKSAPQSHRRRRATFTVGELLRIFDNNLHRSLMQELRSSQGLSAVNYDALDGKPVRGGLPQ